MVVAASGFDVESSKYMGIDAVKKLQLQYNINKVGELSLKYLLLFDFPSPALPLRSSSPFLYPNFILLFLLSSLSFLFLKPFSLLPFSFYPLSFRVHCRLLPEEQNRYC